MISKLALRNLRYFDICCVASRSGKTEQLTGESAKAEWLKRLKRERTTGGKEEAGDGMPSPVF